ncbi:Ig-like domain-containing protein [Herbidospora sp. NBRC 101105]|uniref:Ig-like domain-containing protein n=1 Tax=Herbidospora sp. NBRC 101105 TaxID=3032195 RepID=UPI0024A38E7E|nr:Ig-like domain-containing protein [Herbidospora sp. NBRC 101105]GLX97413.1 hypothetical protein Hesp01_53630 [Herbidospora sp. NBRC 101105]
MNTSRLALGLSAQTRRRAALITALTLPLSLMSAPAIAQDLTSTPIPTQVRTPTPATSQPSVPTTPIGKALAQSKKENRRVEIESLRSESTTIYANPDGKTVRVELSTEPVRVKKADGEGFAPIDTTLVEQDGVIKPKAIQGDLTLSAGADTVVLKSKTAQDITEIEAPDGRLPKPTLKGNTATYRSVYGKGRDLVVIANATGFRQQITIAERPVGPVSFRVPFDLPKGMSFGKNAAGRPIVVGKDGKTLTEVRPTLLQDATAADASAPLDAGKIGRAAVTLAEDGKTLVFTPDAAFLADAATTYPVTMTAAASDWYESHTGVGAGMDVYINDVDLREGWDTFSDPEVVVGKSYASSVAKRWRGYLKFPNIPAEFAGSTVENADLHLWNHLSNTCGTSVGSGITARQVTSTWDDMLLSWNSQPSVIGTGADTEYGAYSEDCNYAWNLTHSLDDIVQSWVNGATNHGIQLTAGNESELRNWRRYASEEAGGCRTSPLEDCKFQPHPPILSIDFVEPPAPLRRETVVISSREPLTSIPEYEEALTRSVYVPEIPESIESLAMSEEQVTATEQHRDGEGSFIGTDNLSPADPAEGDGDTSNPEGEDTVAPRVLATEPAGDATEVPLDSQIKVTFTEEVGEPVIAVKTVQGADVQGAVAIDSTGKIATFTPAQPLHPGMGYTVDVSEAIDAWENVMEPYTWSFTTSGPDTTAPTVTATNPATGAADVSVTTAVSATFGELVSEAEITLEDPAGAAVPGTSAMDGTGRVLTFIPSQPLAPNTVYSAEVSGAKDAAGNVMAAPYGWSFTTAPPDTTAPTVTETVPGPDASGVAVTTAVKVTFSEPVSAAQTAVKGPADAPVAGNTVMDAENKVLTFTPAQAWTPATKYTVAVSAAKDAAGNTMAPHSWSFTTVGNPIGTNGTDYPINDNATVESPITMSGYSGNASTTSTVEVHIAHTYIGDLQVDLVAPDGSTYPLHSHTGSDTDNIDQTYTVNLSSEPINGTWKLRVNDNAGGDTGKIDSWKLTLGGPATPSIPTGSNPDDVAITDNATVESPITMSGYSGNASTTSTVEVHIAHTYIGDLQVDLVAPDGSTYPLHSHTGSDTDNIDQTYTVNLSSEPINGTWKLRVNDNAGGDTGKIDSWKLTLGGPAPAGLQAQAEPEQRTAAPTLSRAPAENSQPSQDGAAADRTAAAATGGTFDYEHSSLEDCRVSPRGTDYAEYDARIEELPYSSCWSAYLYLQDYEYDPDTHKMKKANRRSNVFAMFAEHVGEEVEELFDDDDAFRFRATWVIHSYLGDKTGNSVVNGAGSGLKPTTMKMFLRLDDFAVVDDSDGGEVKFSGNRMGGLPITAGLLTGARSGSNGDCDPDGQTRHKDVSEWHSTPDAMFLISASVPSNSTMICSFTPSLLLHTDDGITVLNLWSQEVKDEDGLTIGVRRHGSEEPYDFTWVPNFRCDRKTFGAGNDDVPDHTGGCVNTRSKRVFVMSKSRDARFIEVIEHIEAALNPSNSQTFPPLRPGHNWGDPSHPPSRFGPVGGQNKQIPGNWGAPGANNPAGKPLTRGMTKAEANAEGTIPTYDYNRNYFSKRELHMDVGTAQEMHWLLPPSLPVPPATELEHNIREKERERRAWSINYCKYYMPEKYRAPNTADKLPGGMGNSCDEYPFASTLQGAAYAQGNFSLKAVNARQNSLHGTALETFYTQFRVGRGTKFWVLIES